VVLSVFHQRVPFISRSATSDRYERGRKSHRNRYSTKYSSEAIQSWPTTLSSTLRSSSKVRLLPDSSDQCTTGICWIANDRVSQAGYFFYLFSFFFSTGRLDTASGLVCGWLRHGLASWTGWTSLDFVGLDGFGGFDGRRRMLRARGRVADK